MAQSHAIRNVSLFVVAVSACASAVTQAPSSSPSLAADSGTAASERDAAPTASGPDDAGAAAPVGGSGGFIDASAGSRAQPDAASPDAAQMIVRTCRYGDRKYAAGSMFPSSDGCNTCSCGDDGETFCTERACVTDADAGATPMECSDLPPAQICVRGEPTLDGKEMLRARDQLKLTVYPRGCFSSSCTRVEIARCSIGASFEVEAQFCLAAVSGVNSCTPDCNGGGFAECQSNNALTAGTHTVTLGSLRVDFTVPSTLPLGGQCTGSAF